MSALQLAIEKGRTAMSAVIQAAEREAPGFSDDAFYFVCLFAARTREFSGEAVRAAAEEAGIVTDRLRAWGPVLQRAARAGVIRRSSSWYPRACGHGTETRGWESLVYSAAAQEAKA